MAKTRTPASTSTSTESATESTTETNIPERSDPINVGPDRSTGLIAAWDGVYPVFGGRFTGYSMTPEGLVIEGFTVAGKYASIVDQLLTDLNASTHKPRLFPTLRWLNGETPEPFARDQDGTTWSVQAFKGSVPDGATRTPKYAREAMSELKSGTPGGKKTRGPRKSSINLKNINIETLAGYDQEGLAALQSILAQVLDSKESKVEARA